VIAARAAVRKRGSKEFAEPQGAAWAIDMWGYVFSNKSGVPC
jgi:hypothetical protein